MKKALVLAGGGTRGSYQVGAIKALQELGRDDWNLVNGTSIGALNAALAVQNDYAAMNELWDNLTQDDIIKGGIPINFDLNTMINERNALTSFFKNYIKEQGADVSPLIAQIHRLYNPARFFSSKIDFGCITVNHRTQEPMYVNKRMMKEYGEQWLLASASAFPAFPKCRIGEEEYVDGGYFDNLPIDQALRMGAEEIIAIDLNSVPQHPNYMDRAHIKYLYPKVETGSFLDFDHDNIMRLKRLGYLDTMKAYGELDGVKYTFKKTRLPKFFAGFERDLLMLETRIKLATAINERLRSSDVITERLREEEHRTHLHEKDLFFGLMDHLMDIAGCDVQHVYTYREARDIILASFAHVADQQYEYIPGLNPVKVIDYTRTLDQKGIVEKIVHGMLYPDHNALSENMILTVYPFEEALAMMVAAMMKELGGE
ncbi:MAG: patatin-like phospholipase family protein [Solobacterium sp.]|jgi:predicted acylesterase/phospholipase RssA|nr:patatin-like phospholipase family protein [Solobacterium sp.]MCH4222913.1 patatin-like phospholipase family protein [Solobacterium sp.]